eukprot:2532520-Alexandrium_andersonii.AAC.1
MEASGVNASPIRPSGWSVLECTVRGCVNAQFSVARKYTVQCATEACSPDWLGVGTSRRRREMPTQSGEQACAAHDAERRGVPCTDTQPCA